jgi:hypothetical protein
MSSSCLSGISPSSYATRGAHSRRRSVVAAAATAARTATPCRRNRSVRPTSPVSTAAAPAVYAPASMATGRRRAAVRYRNARGRVSTMDATGSSKSRLAPAPSTATATPTSRHRCCGWRSTNQGGRRVAVPAMASAGAVPNRATRRDAEPVSGKEHQPQHMRLHQHRRRLVDAARPAPALTPAGRHLRKPACSTGLSRLMPQLPTALIANRMNRFSRRHRATSGGRPCATRIGRRGGARRNLLTRAVRA